MIVYRRQLTKYIYIFVPVRAHRINIRQQEGNMRQVLELTKCSYTHEVTSPHLTCTGNGYKYLEVRAADVDDNMFCTRMCIEPPRQHESKRQQGMTCRRVR